MDRYLQDEIQQEDANEDGLLRFSEFVEDHSGAFVGYVILGISLTILFYCLVKELVMKIWGVEVCPAALGRTPRSREERRQLLEDERLAMELQRQMNETDRQAAIEQRRQERRKKYEVFLEPYTMVVKEEDLVQAPVVSATDNNSVGRTTLVSNNDGEEAYEVYSASVDNMGNFDAELGVDAPTSTSPLLDFTQGDGSFLSLPASRSHPARQAETCCAICLTDYQVGDRVVYSCKRECPHVFHEDCIMTWLSKGKKRCPICRHWFVPSTSIDDKKVITNDEDVASLSGGDTVPSEGFSTDRSSDSEDDPLLDV